ncbi:hypothetical protein JKA73_25245 [Myxococcus xanthus]|uniref:hypothetical protein n=1 Tax=Myxococcus xanthus TaxID=34 RepID=UPI00191753E8|nr:hypothetical protein [Myxococcus xanthus]QQR42402.1 hypothetical protein JKA73_25245 [Myxococcus xanthus]
MKNLTIPNKDPISFYDAIANAKHDPRKTRLKTLQPQIISRYADYKNNLTCLGKITQATYSIEEFQDLQHCYDSSTVPLNELKSHIRSIQSPISRAICPHCGINNPRTFDHHLPESIFPDFSVLSWNLIPMCDECNNTKLDKTSEANIETPVLNLYFDTLPDSERWLYAQINISAGLPEATFTLQQTPTIDPSIFNRIKHHYTTLNLFNRYADRSVEVFSEAASKASSGLTPQEFKTAITTCARSYEKRHGLNYWKVATLDAMANSTDYIESALETHSNQ